MKLAETHSRPPTIHFTSRCDARHLATLARMWQIRGEMPRSNSELVRLSLETFVEILVTSGQAEFVPTQGEAQEILGSIGLLGKGIMRQNLVEAITREGNLSALEGSPLHKSSGRVAHDSPDILAAARKLEEALSNPEEFARRQEARDKELKDLLGTTPENI